MHEDSRGGRAGRMTGNRAELLDDFYQTKNNHNKVWQKNGKINTKRRKNK